MKTRFLLCSAALLLLASTLFSANEPTAAAGSTKTPVALPLSPRFRQVRERIDALFRLRNESPSLPEPRSNPFRPPGAMTAPPESGPTAANSAGLAVDTDPPGDLAVLQQAVATLKITGVVERGNEAHIGINAKLYKKGDVVQALLQGQTVYLRVREITRRSATLTLNEAEMTLKF